VNVSVGAIERDQNVCRHGEYPAPPRTDMNSRRLMAGMGSPHPVQPVSRTLSLARRDGLVLGQR